jgi:pyruvate dehydrogenase (quinone)
MVEPATGSVTAPGGPHGVEGSAAEAFIETIHRWGVDTIFGLPGDGINGLMEALRVHQDKVRFVQVRHEEAAAFMASAYAKYTGRLGCCIATSGPGAIHLLNGLYDAKMDGQPVLAITGMTYHDMIGTFYQQDVNTERLFEDVSVYDERVMSGSQAEQLADLACRAALSKRGVAHVTFPNDLQEVEAGARRSKANIAEHSSSAYQPERALPTHEQLERMAEILNAGKKVAILAGRGALDAGDELEQVAEMLGAPIAKPLLGKAAVPDESPYCTGGLGLLGTAPSEEAMEECDTLFIVGSSYPYMEFLPQPGQARGVQIDLDPERIGLRYPVELGVAGDSRTVLRALLPLLHRNEDRSFLEKAQKGMRDWWALLDERGTRTETPMHPAVVAYELNKLLDDNAIISTDSGTNTTWAARYIRIRKGQMFSCSGNLATMAPGFPYTNAAQVAYPNRQCVALVGDGGFTMLMGELATAVKYKLPVKIIIFKNDVLGQIKWEQMVFLGNPQYGVELQPIDFAKYAEAVGARGFTITDPQECRATLAEALRHPGPVVVQAVVDPNEPPMPAKVKLEQVTKMAEALARGEPNRVRIGETLFRDKVDDLLAPGGHADGNGVVEKVKDKLRDIVE